MEVILTKRQIAARKGVETKRQKLIKHIKSLRIKVIKINKVEERALHAYINNKSIY